MNVFVIGGGAAGIFAAINCKERHPQAQVILVEKSNKLLSKVKISGGGRCNVTNATFSPSQLAKNYPRGDKFLKKAFSQFNAADTVEWFKNHDVKLVAEEDKRMFPSSNDSQTVVDCLLNTARSLGIQILKKTTIESINKKGSKFELIADDSEFEADKLIIATGGNPKESSYDWFKGFGHSIVKPQPSLFTFNMPGESIKELPGLVAKNVSARILGTKLKSEGDLLITHWGMSGPAILKLSAWGARELAALNYHFTISINWLGDQNDETVKQSFPIQSNKKVINEHPFDFPKRLWTHFLDKVGIQQGTIWSTLSKKEKNKLSNLLTNDQYLVEGKTTFKEEFVTCGGIPLSEVDVKTMKSKTCPNLYFCGEVMDIDGITGGFNFQAAWTTGYIAAKLE